VRREHLVALTKSPSLWTDTLKGQPGAKASLAASRKPLGGENRQLSLEEIFELIDLDGDGELTKDEVCGKPIKNDGPLNAISNTPSILERP
jgi:hypothetical protein